MIVYDYREERSGVPGLLRRLKVPLTRAELKVGDYVLSGTFNVAVERKTVMDYVASLESKHLNNQLYELSTNYPYSILIVEGFVTEALMFRKIKRQTVLSSLAGSLLKRSPDGEKGVISVVMLETPFDTALFLYYLHRKLVEGDILRLPELKASKWKPEERAVGVLASFPLVGEERARRLLERFGSLREVLNASVEELCRVEGIGPKIARGIVELANKPYSRSTEERSRGGE